MTIVVFGGVQNSLDFIHMGRNERLVCSVDWMDPSTVKDARLFLLCEYMVMQMDERRVE